MQLATDVLAHTLDGVFGGWNFEPKEKPKPKAHYKVCLSTSELSPIYVDFKKDRAAAFAFYNQLLKKPIIAKVVIAKKGCDVNGKQMPKAKVATLQAENDLLFIQLLHNGHLVDMRIFVNDFANVEV